MPPTQGVSVSRFDRIYKIHDILRTARHAAQRTFDPIADATLTGKQLTFHYAARSGTGRKLRKVHPQKLLHYRSNWYLLAQCNEAEALRLFSLYRITGPEISQANAETLTAEELDAFTSSSFGIFGGNPKGTAHLVFSPHSAQWVAEENWHAGQVGEWREDGYHLKVPYSDEREIAMEVLRYGAEVEVMGPGELRAEVAGRVRKMSKMYC